MNATDYLVWGVVAHTVADLILQSEWMALNKVSLRHPAAWVHSGIHLVALLFVFPPVVATAIAISHLLIDTRVPLQWWRKFYHQTTEGPIFIPFALLQDQAAHLIALAVAAYATVHL